MGRSPPYQYLVMYSKHHVVQLYSVKTLTKKSGNQFIMHKKYFHSHANKNHAANPKNFEKNSSQSPHRKKRIHSNSSNINTSILHTTLSHTQNSHKSTQDHKTTFRGFTFPSYHSFISVKIPEKFKIPRDFHRHTHTLTYISTTTFQNSILISFSFFFFNHHSIPLKFNNHQFQNNQ